MLDGLISGFEVALSPENVLFVFLGVLIGTVVGVLPGLGPLAAIAVLLPLTYSLSASTAIIFLAGVYYGSMFGGRIPAILLNIPGDSSSVVTTFDGYPLAQKGRGGAALSITAIGSFIGGSVSLIGLTFLAPLVSQVAVGMGPPELFMLALFGLFMVTLIGSGGATKSGIAVTFGMLLAVIGMDPMTGAQRLTFGFQELIDGIHIVPLVLGLFGIAEVLIDTERRYSRGDGPKALKKNFPSLADWISVRWAILRASVVGFFIGVIPGGGGTVSSIVAYGMEKKVSKNGEKFGHGAMDGLASTETADNASSTSSFIPLLTLGIPPNPVLAVLAGALILHNVTPGPQLMDENPDIFWGVIASMYIGTVVLLILNLPLVGLFVKILKVPAPVLTTIILCLAVFGVFSVRQSFFDVALMFVFGIVGYGFRKIGIPAGVLIIGFILAPILEGHFRRSMIMSAGSLDIFLQRPVTVTLICGIGILVLGSVIPKIRGALKGGLETRYRARLSRRRE